MRAEIISVGTELLLGHIIDTNAPFLSRKLAGIGIDLYHRVTVGDNPDRLANAIERAAKRSDIVITSGGLGPTVDDITAQTVTQLTRMQPTLIHNKVGSAPGIITKFKDTVIVCLPGPPREFEPMVKHDIVPYLRKISKSPFIIRSRTVKICGLPESRVDGVVRDLLHLPPPTTVGIYAKPGQVELKIMSKSASERQAKSSIEKIEREIRARLKDHIFGYDDDTLESIVGGLLTKKRLTIAVAESCTGGMLSQRITNVSGSSKYFLMGLVAYSNAVKENVLGVPRETIKRYGAVSRQTALAMAEGAMALSGAKVGVGITGIAGPAGGTKAKPVGLVYVAIVTRYPHCRSPLRVTYHRHTAKEKRLVRELRLSGSREDVRLQATQTALDMLRRGVRPFRVRP